MSPDLETVREARARFGELLLSNPDVHAVGVGRRRRADQRTDEYAVVLHVRRKIPLEQVQESRRIPRELHFVTQNGRNAVVHVDVQEHEVPKPETGEPEGVAMRGPLRMRPVPGGCSAGTGTLGGWVWDTQSRQVVALSNRHVFGSLPGTVISQPSLRDGGRLPEDAIATVVRAGALDASIAAPTDRAIFSLEILQVGAAVFAIADPAVDMRVVKVGQTTGLTRGVVDLIDCDYGHYGSRVDVRVEGFEGNFSNGGDSGALYIEELDDAIQGFPRIVGLHWGGTANSGVGHPIRAVFNDLGLSVLPPPG